MRLAMSCCTIATATTISGCASGQLDYNTLDIASTTDSLLTKQVLYNLSNYIDNDISIPAQIVISAGTESTTNTITPSVTFPLSNAFTLVQTAARATGMAGNSIGSSNTSGVSAAGGALSGTNAAAQNLGFSLVTDPYALHRLRALYRFAVHQSTHPNPKDVATNNKDLSNHILGFLSQYPCLVLCV
jgi:hypothetical protein